MFRWAKDGYFVSFKLETDLDLLIKKARAAIEKYNVDLVVANELHTRYKQVKLVTENEVINVDKVGTKDIEESFLTEVILRHKAKMKSS